VLKIKNIQPLYVWTGAATHCPYERPVQTGPFKRVLKSTRLNGPFERSVRTARLNGPFGRTVRTAAGTHYPFRRPIQTARSNGC